METDDCNSDSDEPPTYTGSQDEAGLPHGRGTLSYSSGETFCGHFCHGEREGRGTMLFDDESWLTGSYVGDNLEGAGVYCFPDGSYMEGTYTEGMLNGPAREYNADDVLTFEGRYRDNVRTGVCWVHNQDGGCLVGLVDQQGAMTGHSIAYIYPDQKTAVVGKFEDGALVKGQLAEIISVKKRVPSFRKYGPTFCRDVSTEKVISKEKLRPDPYEQERIYVKNSLIPGANEGLFCKVAAPAGTVMSFYNGIRLPHEQVDSRDWEENGNTISLNEDVVIDVPAAHIPTANYCASLGHKANHSFSPNSMYDVFDHPRFGAIKCIRTIKAVTPDEELTVFYGYEHEDSKGDAKAPQWYLQQEADYNDGKQKHRTLAVNGKRKRPAVNGKRKRPTVNGKQKRPAVNGKKIRKTLRENIH